MQYVGMTRLHRFMDRNRITDTVLSRTSGVSVRQVNYLKLGQHDPRLGTMVAILNACRTLTNRRNVLITDLFNFDTERKVNRLPKQRNQVSQNVSEQLHRRAV
jgi:predicted transcriptional regulator